MARKWKRHKAVLFQQPHQQSDVNMIEKSIKKHEEKSAIVTYANQNNGRQFWPKMKYDMHIAEHQKKGYVIGASIETKYGVLGTILNFKECPDEGITFYGGDSPCCAYIRRAGPVADTGNSMLYGFNELTLKEQS